MSHAMYAAAEDHSRNTGAISGKDRDAPLRILIADDQEASRTPVAEFLKHRGYGVAVADNGREAVGKWEGGGLDLILMDIHMPLVDGIEATWIIRTHEKEGGAYTPIIACSSNHAKELTEGVSSLGFDGFIRKPFLFETLLEEIFRCTQLKREE